MSGSQYFAHEPSHFIGGRFVPVTGDDIVSTDPAAPHRVIWQGSPTDDVVDDAVTSARAAARAWAATALDERIEFLRCWQAVTLEHADRMADLIGAEMGKIMSEARFEANALAAKVDVTLGAHSAGRIQPYEVAVNDSRVGQCRFKPHGVMVVLGPFNFPAHLPNGQIVPALLAGNTIVFKPSEKTPAVGQLMAELMDEVIRRTGAPPGVFNMVQGGPDVARALVDHDDVDGILFTGSWPVGRSILETNLDRPGRIVALEMGGNNPAVIMPDANLHQAIAECVRASFATTGQRCTCTRRIIVHRDVAGIVVPALCKSASTLVVGDGQNPNAFMGPLISDTAVDQVLSFQTELEQAGAHVHLACASLDRDGHFITPGVVEVDAFDLDRDCEIFGPLVQVTVVADLDDAITQANATRYGLAAAIFTADETTYERFFAGVHAGCINWNTGTAGASSALPFGGLGHSGNHRPAAAFAIDACAYPVAAMLERSPADAIPGNVFVDAAWLQETAR